MRCGEESEERSPVCHEKKQFGSRDVRKCSWRDLNPQLSAHKTDTLTN